VAEEVGESIMAQATKRSLNELLVKLLNNVMDLEGKAVITEEYRDITNNDMHIIEAIGVDEPRNMSVIAHRMNVTVSTLTTNVNGLEKKGYIRRERSSEDKRVVYVILTEKGRKAFYHHRDFHKNMIKAIVKDLTEAEMEILNHCLTNLNVYLEREADHAGR
jgi:DNA-binding MarR family transcriptional regulator